MPNDTRVGITTTIPIEPLIAAGLTPIDLNNLFISHPDPASLVSLAEQNGFPRNSCSWIKGMFGAAVESGITSMVDLASGDCDAGRVLSEIMSARGVRLYRFAFPLNFATGEHRISETRRQIESLCSQVGVAPEAAESVFGNLREARIAALDLDREATTGPANCRELAGGRLVYKSLISTSDFDGDAAEHRNMSRQALSMLQDASGDSSPAPLRIGIVGIPPIFSNLFEVIDEFGGLVVYHEVPHQFALPAVQEGADMYQAYAGYSYPKTVSARAEVIRRECAGRWIDVLVHNVQTFCHRQIEDLLMKSYLPYPVLTLEGDRPGKVDARTRLRLEAFIAGRRRAK